ncbi:hypothetical protein LC612_28345 [Nostoc sp. CHAB 5834]|nr:hypothetical protein [Nostoc sp. CHAB 5834]
MKFPYELRSYTRSNGDAHIGYIREGNFQGATLTVGLSDEAASYLKKVNDLLDSSTTRALDELCLSVQEGLGVETGDYAGLYFSGSEKANPLREVIAEYLLSEIRNKAEVDDI